MLHAANIDDGHMDKTYNQEKIEEDGVDKIVTCQMAILLQQKSIAPLNIFVHEGIRAESICVA